MFDGHPHPENLGWPSKLKTHGKCSVDKSHQDGIPTLALANRPFIADWLLRRVVAYALRDCGFATLYGKMSHKAYATTL